MLQGKAKEEFGEQSKLDYNDFIALPLVCQQALIIEWFSTLKYKGQDFWLYHFDFFYKHRIESQTISDINKQAIEKAVEIFNQLNK